MQIVVSAIQEIEVDYVFGAWVIYVARELADSTSLGSSLRFHYLMCIFSFGIGRH